MTTIERKDLANAVLLSRDELDPDLEAELLEAVVDAEADASGDSETALRAIDAAVVAAIARGVGHVEPVTEAAGTDEDDEAGEDED